jgi:hypothetical protein
MKPGDLVEVTQWVRNAAYSSQGDFDKVGYKDLTKGVRGLVVEECSPHVGDVFVVLIDGRHYMVWRSRLRVIE